MAVAEIARWEWCFKREGGKVDAGLSVVWDGEEFGAFYRGWWRGEELQRLQWQAVVGSLYFTSFGEGKG
jgi:hypothetical protein